MLEDLEKYDKRNALMRKETGMTTTGKITKYDGERLYIIAPFTNKYLLEKQRPEEVEIRLIDSRKVSAKQRNKIFALINDIGNFVSRVQNNREYEEMRRELQVNYIYDITDNEALRRTITKKYCDLCNIDIFSLSDCSMSTAADFIDWLVEKCIRYSIPCNDSLLYLCEDSGRYIYACVAERKCAICGKKAEIHEWEKVGMGGNRRKMHHLGQLVEPLCRQHHHEEENIGQEAFDLKYIIHPIKLDEYLCKKIGWKA